MPHAAPLARFHSFASPRPGDVDPKFDMELDPPAEALRQFMARTCRLSDDQLRNHVFRHSAMHAHRAHEDGVRRPVAIFSQVGAGCRSAN